MNVVNIYEGSNSIQQEFCRQKLEICKTRFNFASPEKSSALYLGCGVGDAMVNEFIPNLPKNITRIIGVDSKIEVIQAARITHPTYQSIFKYLDLQNVNMPVNEKFDNIVSYWCLRWVHKPEIALRNLMRLLNDNASVLLIFEYKNSYFHAIRMLAEMPEWKPYLKPMVSGMCAYDFGFDPRRYIGKELKSLNLKNLEITCDENINYVYVDVDMMEDDLHEMYCVDELIPVEKLDQFYEEIYLFLAWDFKVTNNGTDEVIRIPSKVFTAMFEK